ncbi:LysR family transcriptional regulator [Actinobacteria bacterium YIM 96077]|uniref:LysR family transcriptional regulator n=1 Tax=Phytoactinopolyspora halophila TaxID=1981511 RepID=A0A329QWL2_9ACTN|nr:LysR family transcriptional regulator [Phytoactinopolyspora halophila]AYY13765.1 LysR family transcriptional regulator [Actinobacteria bacterium YIM 96077]RAW15692.1 LysR family transcriptional regulator [Phytoactinopolyspora halophila]
MELRQIRYVMAVAETRNFTRAATQCYVAQSALSHQVKALEQELGVALFARTSRRVELTPAGAAFIPAAQECLDAAERAAADAAAAVGEVRGRLAIGIIPTVAALDIPATLQRFRERHPRVRVSLRVGASDEMAADVAAGNLDIAILGLPAHDRPQDVEVRELARQDLVAVVPVNHQLAERGTVTLRELAESPFADFHTGSPGRAQSDEAFAAAELERTVAYEVTSAELMMRIVSQGLAVAFLPAPIAQSNPDVRVLSVTDGPRRIEYLAWSEFNPTPATRAFLASLPSL